MTDTRQHIDALFAEATHIHECRRQIDETTRAFESGELSAGEAVTQLMRSYWSLDDTTGQTGH